MPGFFTIAELGPKRKITPEGFLLCEEVPICRTGQQTYGPGETPIEVGPSGYAIIDRPDKEVFREETLNSGQGKPVTFDDTTYDHPPKPKPGLWTVRPDNWNRWSVGVVINPRRSKEDKDLMIADLVIWDDDAIEAIDEGLNQVSCGYGCEYREIAGTPGYGEQYNILINHVALVENARCGTRCTIHDAAPKPVLFEEVCGCKGESMSRWKQLVSSLRTAFQTGDKAKIEAALTQVADAEPEEPEGKDMESRMKQMHDSLTDLQNRMTTHDAYRTAHDAVHEQLNQRLDKLEQGEEDFGAGKTDDAEIPGEIPKQQHDSFRTLTVKDSRFLGDAYREVIAGVEVLKPGTVVFTFDSKTPARQTYKQLCGTRKAALVASLTSDSSLCSQIFGTNVTSQDIEAMPCSQVRDSFRGLVALKKHVNNNDRNGAVVRQDDKDKKRGPQSLADLNKMHRDRTQNRA